MATFWCREELKRLGFKFNPPISTPEGNFETDAYWERTEAQAAEYDRGLGRGE